MARTRKPRTLLEVCVARAIAVAGDDPSSIRAGVKAMPKGMRVGTFIVEWAVAARELGRPVTAEDVAEWWNLSPATAYRRLAEYRELFDPIEGERSTPAHLAAVINGELDGRELRRRDVAGLLTAPLPDEAAAA